jgi:hypothetical protein
MKYILCIIVTTVFVRTQAQVTATNGILGTWQQVENKTCFESQLPESETEKELKPDMGGSSRTSVARLIRFDSKGAGEEGIFSKGRKKGNAMSAFRYNVNGQELQLLDKKSGIVSQRFIIEELTDTSLKIHDAVKDCEVRSFSRVK